MKMFHAWALVVCASGLTAQTPTKVVEMFQDALALHKSGAQEEALAAYEDLQMIDVQEDCLSPQAREVLCTNAAALTLSVDGDKLKAGKWLEAAASANPMSPKALTNECSYYGRPECCVRALEIDPSFDPAMTALETLAVNTNVGQEEFKRAQTIRGEFNRVASKRPLDPLVDIESKFPADLQMERLFDVNPRTQKALPPYIWRFKNFLSREDLEKIHETLVNDAKWTASETTASPERTRISESAWIPRSNVLDSKSASIAGVDLDVFRQRSEQPQLVRYKHGGFFKTHCDWLPVGIYKFREATLLYYLNDAFAPTKFPFARRDKAFRKSFPRHDPDLADDMAWDDDSLNNGIQIMPKAGDALLFVNVDLNSRNQSDAFALHTALPLRTEKEVKIIANQWFQLPP